MDTESERAAHVPTSDRGAYGSSICLATTQAAARHNLPHVVDVGVADQIVERGLTNTFRFGPGLKKVTGVALDNLVKINDAAGKLLGIMVQPLLEADPAEQLPGADAHRVEAPPVQ